MFYYIDKSVLVEKRPFVKFIGNYIRDSSSVFTISMTSFPTVTQLFVQKYSLTCLYNKKKITLWLEDILFSRGKKQYFTHSLRSFIKYCSYHSKIKFISSRRCVISSVYSSEYARKSGFDLRY